MSIRIEEERCIGCGRCVEACPGNLLKLLQDEKRRYARIREVRDCWGCTACLKNCPADAIRFFLGEDIGGTGAELSVRSHGPVRDWIIHRPDGTGEIISVDSRESNRY